MYKYTSTIYNYKQLNLGSCVTRYAKTLMYVCVVQYRFIYLFGLRPTLHAFTGHVGPRYTG